MNGGVVLTLPRHLLEAQGDNGAQPRAQSWRPLELLQDNFLSQVLDKLG